MYKAPYKIPKAVPFFLCADVKLIFSKPLKYSTISKNVVKAK